MINFEIMFLHYFFLVALVELTAYSIYYRLDSGVHTPHRWVDSTQWLRKCYSKMKSDNYPSIWFWSIWFSVYEKNFTNRVRVTSWLVSVFPRSCKPAYKQNIIIGIECVSTLTPYFSEYAVVIGYQWRHIPTYHKTFRERFVLCGSNMVEKC